jgi:hypothetical protein
MTTQKEIPRMKSIFSSRPFGPASCIIYVYLTLNGQFPANPAAAHTDTATLGSQEVFGYDPSSGRTVITSIHADLEGLSNRYDGHSWGINWQMHFADLNGDGNDEVFRYDPSSGHAIITSIRADLTGFSNKYDGYGWGTYRELYFADLNGDGDDEIFCYNPDTGHALITSIHADLEGLNNEYSGYGWGMYRELHFADLDGR